MNYYSFLWIIIHFYEFLWIIIHFYELLLFFISIRTALKFVPKGPTNNNKAALVQVLAWHRMGGGGGN